MSLRSRIGRLPEPPGPAAAQARVAPAVASESPQSSVLDDLRARMDGLLRQPPTSRSVDPVQGPELPFAVEQTRHGPLHVRTLRLSATHLVGRVPVAPAKDVAPERLAVLAIDPRLAACNMHEVLYLDTETTGLGPGAGTVAFLVGLAFWDADLGLIVEQLLVKTLGQERPVLERVRQRLARASMLVTFNGKSFDMPVLRSRFVMAHAEAPIEPPHLDLLHVARRLHKGRGLGTRLGTLERELLGFVREDDVPSAEVSACYMQFVRHGDTRPLIRVVEHNAWDVVSMAALVGVYGEDAERAMLAPPDLVGLARTWNRAAGAWRRSGDASRRDAAPAMSDRAYAIAAVAEERGAGAEAVRACAEIAKARGDKGRALTDFEALDAEIDCPLVRLELAKLYEHHAKDPARALELTRRGTGEGEAGEARRTTRLRQKLDKSSEIAARTGKGTLKLW